MVDQASHPLRDVCLWLGEKVFNHIIYVHGMLHKWRIEEVNLAENRTALDFDLKKQEGVSERVFLGTSDV